ncbi:hypothetical protein C8E00_102487 [Chromohalobacter marismortui]|uniref:Uncharacterized protein n=1 Tax=Chromohalobacter marismortui TaxID=42055 RepID=A0A4R7NSS7_9GAMM|nr:MULTISPECIES: hypothetical protein [Chromohalobacter]MCI0509121.1 hypothetical protein [Chromohalobacter sp.]MCI0592788.1 hypothetical protein [Chromohalobacter sp.]TDU23987.1 hypothetical protein C8E00_102487 [Chromohalobacter marismortui]
MTDRQHNAAWQAAQQWRERARQSRPSQGAGGLKLLATWLVVGVMMIVGTLLGLFFLIVGWAMLPFLRHRMKKRAETFRAEHARPVGGSGAQDGTQTRDDAHSSHVLEGDYRVKSDD